MTAQKGKDLLLKVDSNGEGSFTTVAGLRARTLAFTAAVTAIGLWAVGDMTLAELVAALPVALGGLGIAALGAKVDAAQTSHAAEEKLAKPE